MTDFSTCRRCKTLLQVTDGNVVHPLCAPILTKVERLEEQLLEACRNHDTELERELEAKIKELENHPPDLLKAALRYARDFGWPVHPLKPGSKEPDTPHGFKDASTDLTRIERYWRKHPTANIGVPTGLPATFDVIDVDAPKRDGQVAGAIAYAELGRTGRLPDTHGMVVTANAGLHLYIEPTGEPCHVNWMASVDYRGIGGYVVVPPSVAASGHWRWLIVPSPVIRRGLA